jgi:hypothetical protein
MPSYARALHALRTWLDSWSGIGHITVGMARQGYDLQLTRYDERGWRATFYTTGMEHSATSATGSTWDRRPWHATQRAAWEALRQASPRWLDPGPRKAREECVLATTFAGYLRTALTRAMAPSPSLWRRRRSSPRTPQGYEVLAVCPEAGISSGSPTFRP